MVALRLTSVALFLALAGCSVGEIPGPAAQPDAPVATPDSGEPPIDGTGTTPDAMGGGEEASFAMKITPIVTRTIGTQMCTQGGCHGPGGLTQPDFTSFATLAERYREKPGAMSKLVTKGAHAGPELPAPDKQVIIDWIDSLPE